MANELSHRERVLLALQHQETDRVPIAMVCSGINSPAREGVDALLRSTRGITLQQYLNGILDIGSVGVPYVGPPLPPNADVWGVVRKPVSYGPGHYMEIDHYPLAEAADVADLDSHRWPELAWYDYGALPQVVRGVQSEGEYCLMVMNGNIFETSWYMRGFQQFMEDFLLSPELAHAILKRVTDFYVEHFSRVLAAANGQIDLVFTADDIGGQEGLLFSLDIWRRFLKPCHERLNRTIHEHGARVIYHTDGAVMEAVPGLIEMGIDILQALQFDAKGMDPVALKSLYGDRLSFQGGVSVQSTLPFGTTDDVRSEVRDRIRTLARRGGYILGPSHAIQAGTPPENVLAMFETALHCPLPPSASSPPLR